MEIIKSFGELPENLLEAEPMSDTSRQYCPRDGWCGADTSDCSTDASSCTRDGCSDCSDCTDCDDTPAEPTSISIISTSSTENSITLVCSVHTQWGGTVWVQATAGGKTGSSSRATMTAGQTRSFTVTITGLSSGTRYTVTAQLNSTAMSGIVSTSTTVYTETPPTPTQIEIDSYTSTETSITLSCWVYVQYGGSVYVTATAGGKTGRSSTYSMGAATSRYFSVTISGLSPGETYTVTATLNSTEMSGIVSDSMSCSTQAEPSSIEITSTSSTYNSITATCQFHVQYGGSGIYVQLWVSGRTVNSAYYTMSANSDKTVTLTVTGLSADTQYEVIAFLRTTAMDPSPVAESQSLGVWTKQLPVEPWTWTGSNGQATAAQTRNAYSILQGTREPNDFSHYVWNDLVDKVVEMRQAVGYSWTTDTGRFPSASGCKVSSGETMSALKYNALKTNVGSIRSTGIPDVSVGDEITGYMIVHITDVLNDIIADL